LAAHSFDLSCKQRELAQIEAARALRTSDAIYGHSLSTDLSLENDNLFVSVKSFK
jgi:hypothetical protein